MSFEAFNNIFVSFLRKIHNKDEIDEVLEKWNQEIKNNIVIKPDEKKPNEKKPDEKKPDEKKPVISKYKNFIITKKEEIKEKDNKGVVLTEFIDIVKSQKNKEEENDIWKDSIYKELVKLQSNNAGIVGENFLQNICIKSGIKAKITGSKTKKIIGDGTIKDKNVEIKLAHQGAKTKSFQHELGENPWFSDYIIFIDVTPEFIYLTIFKNFDEEFYKSGNKCKPYFPTKSITWRKKTGAFKLDTTVSINEKNLNKTTLKITNDTKMTEIKKFINLRIN